MPLKIIRNDITKMHTEAIVNTANESPVYSTGCDTAIYKAAGEEQLLEYRRIHVGYKNEGDVFITPGFKLSAKYIIHAVSPAYIDGNSGEEELLRKCYRDSLALASKNHIKSISFPLISTGSFGYPKEEGMRIAVDEINVFLLNHYMDIYLVVFDTVSTLLGERLYPELESYIDHNYVCNKREEEYGARYFSSSIRREVYPQEANYHKDKSTNRGFIDKLPIIGSVHADKESVIAPPVQETPMQAGIFRQDEDKACMAYSMASSECCDGENTLFNETKLNERMQHLSDTFSQYLLYLIASKGMDNVDVYKRAIVDKKMFSKIKNNTDYHPQKITALCLCVGAKLNLDETKDLLARAGYALSPCDKTDIIFSFFIENKIYDMIEIDIQLEEHGLPCIIQ